MKFLPNWSDMIKFPVKVYNSSCLNKLKLVLKGEAGFVLLT